MDDALGVQCSLWPELCIWGPRGLHISLYPSYNTHLDLDQEYPVALLPISIPW